MLTQSSDANMLHFPGGDELIPFNASKIEIHGLRLWAHLRNIAFLMEIAKAHMTQFSELSFVKESWQSIMSCSITTLEINSKWHVQLIWMPEKVHGSDSWVLDKYSIS